MSTPITFITHFLDKIPVMGANGLNLWPFAEWEARTHALDMVLAKSKTRGNPVWVGSWAETKEAVKGLFRGAYCLCPGPMSIWGIRTSHGQPSSKTRRQFSKVSQIISPGKLPILSNSKTGFWISKAWKGSRDRTEKNKGVFIVYVLSKSGK